MIGLDHKYTTYLIKYKTDFSNFTKKYTTPEEIHNFSYNIQLFV